VSNGPSPRFSVIRTDSEHTTCKGQFLSIVSQGGDHYFGMPWFLDEQEKLPSIEEKLKDFTWKALQTPFEVRIDHNRTRDGLYPVHLVQVYEAGKVPLDGEIDPEGKAFFMGHFTSLDTDATEDRLRSFAPYVAKAPTEGASTPKVTIIEFSDFECPSCKTASGFLDPILKKYPGQVKYVRYDLPLLMMHPWAFSAAVAGRAIYRQKPEVFWEYKKQVYSNQDKLGTFTIDDFARNFAQDHDLDLKKYDADLASPEVRADILNGIGVAFSNNILGTPTYVVNGRMVDAGTGGAGLDAYVAKVIGK
jgi:protein-disulfide isomerase